MTTAKREKLDALPTNDELTTMLNALTRRTRLSNFDLSVLNRLWPIRTSKSTD